MNLDYDILPEIILYSSVFFVIYYFLYRKFLYSIIDPLFIFIITTSFASVLVLYTLEDNIKFLYHFFICQIFYVSGFYLSDVQYKRKNKVSYKISSDNLTEHNILRLTIYILFAIYFFANIVIFRTTGFALLSDDPTTSKVENFTKGYGILLKINWGIGYFVIFGVTYLLIIEKRKIDIILLILIIIITALEGSKSAMLKIIFPVILLLKHPLLIYERKLIKFIYYIMPIGIIAVIGILFAVLIKENVDSESALFAFIKRLLYSADSTIFYYLPINQQYFSRINSWEFFPHIARPILSFLRLMPQKEAFGNVMVMNALPNAMGTVVGPNTPFYIEGQIFFGYYGAFLYSLFIGYMYASLRNYFFNNTFKSAFGFLLAATIVNLGTALTNELTLFITQAFDTCFFVIPIYIMLSLVTTGSIRIRSSFLRQFVVK